MQFDKATIHNLAVEMFWRMAADIGVGQANERVLATEGRCLLEHPVDNDLWQQYPLASLADEEASRVLKAVAFEAVNFTRAEQNMIGPVFLEDRQTGRSSSAVAIDTHPLAKAPSFTSTEAIERTGRLCLRHPLPAVVFADRQPQSGIIQVDDTATALGFDLPMFLALTGCQPAPDDTVILTGYFHIPAPDIATGDLWNLVIQNSTRAVSGFTIFRPEGQLAIDFDWDAPAKRRSWFRRS